MLTRICFFFRFFSNFCQFLSNFSFFSQINRFFSTKKTLIEKQKYLGRVGDRTCGFHDCKATTFPTGLWRHINKCVFISDHILKHKRRKWKNWFFNFSRRGTPMILVSFFFSHRALSIGIGRDGIGLKVMEIAQTDRHT